MICQQLNDMLCFILNIEQTRPLGLVRWTSLNHAMGILVQMSHLTVCLSY